MDITELVEINVQEIPLNSVVFNEKTRLWCKLPYKGKQGCPNYEKNPRCPPIAPYLEDKICNSSYEYSTLVYADFDFGTYKNEMKRDHPNWTDNQLGNVLYWQSQIKKMLKTRIIDIFRSNIVNNSKYLFSCGSGFEDKYFIQKEVYSMESVGIDVFQTLRNNDIYFEMKPVNKVLLVCMILSERRLEENEPRGMF